jgi:hypothetical protein
MLTPPFAMTADEIVPNKVGAFPTEIQMFLLSSAVSAFFRPSGAR